MTNNVEPAALMRVIGARRQTQQQLDRLSRQIAAMAGRQLLSRATSARIRMRIPRWRRPRPTPSDKVLYRERVVCLTCERWSEFGVLTIRLFRQDQMIEMLRQGDLGADGPWEPSGGAGLVMPLDGDSG